MIRILIPLLLFMLPFAVYGLFILLRSSTSRTASTSKGAGAAQALLAASPVSLAILSFIGVFLAAVGVGLLGTLISKEHATYYQPPRLTAEGRLIPGQLITGESQESTAAKDAQSSDQP